MTGSFTYSITFYLFVLFIVMDNNTAPVNRQRSRSLNRGPPRTNNNNKSNRRSRSNDRNGFVTLPPIPRGNIEPQVSLKTSFRGNVDRPSIDIKWSYFVKLFQRFIILFPTVLLFRNMRNFLTPLPRSYTLSKPCNFVVDCNVNGDTIDKFTVSAVVKTNTKNIDRISLISLADSLDDLSRLLRDTQLVQNVPSEPDFLFCSTKLTSDGFSSLQARNKYTTRHLRILSSDGTLRFSNTDASTES